MTERRNSERHANIAYKVTQAMEQMRAHGLLNQTYDSTEDFVKELQKYLKISKVCDKDHLTDCWPTEKVIDKGGNEFDVADAKTGENLSLETTTNNVGLLLADGASIILNYDNRSQGLDVGDEVRASRKSLPVGGGKTKDFAYTTTSTNSIDFVMDVNGKSKPNREGLSYDIRSLRTASFYKNTCEGFTVPDVGCVIKLGTNYQAISEAPYTNSNNRWAGAREACIAKDAHLASLQELRDIYKYKCDSTNNPDYNAATCISDIPTTGWFWSSEEYYSYTLNAWRKYLFNGYEGGNTKNGDYGALCVGN